MTTNSTAGTQIPVTTPIDTDLETDPNTDGATTTLPLRKQANATDFEYASSFDSPLQHF